MGIVLLMPEPQRLDELAWILATIQATHPSISCTLACLIGQAEGVALMAQRVGHADKVLALNLAEGIRANVARMPVELSTLSTPADTVEGAAWEYLRALRDVPSLARAEVAYQMALPEDSESRRKDLLEAVEANPRVRAYRDRWLAVARQAPKKVA